MSDMRARLQRIARGVEDPHVDVLDLVNWVYSEQRANRVSGYGLHPTEAAMVGLRHSGATHASAFAGLIEISRLGCRVDRVGSHSGDLHPVAESLHFMVTQIQSSGEAPAWLLVRYGEQVALPAGHDLEMKLGPTWKAEPRYEVRRCSTCDADHALPKKDKFKVVFDPSYAKPALFCPLAWDHGADYQQAERREYGDWHAALRALAARCAHAKLDGVVVTGPAIAREPWLERDAASASIWGAEACDSLLPRMDARAAPAQSFLRSILLAAVDARLRRHEDGLWRAEAEQAFNDGLIARVVKQGLASYGPTDEQGQRVLQVTAAGKEALRSAREIA